MPFRLTAALLALLSGPAAGSLPFRTASFRATITAGTASPVIERVWISPQGSLEERPGEPGVTHVLRTRGEIFIWIEGTGRGLRAPDAGPSRDSGAPGIPELLRGLSADVAPGSAYRVSRERLSGRTVRRYDFHRRDSVSGTDREGTAWLLEESDFPVKYRGRGLAGLFEIVTDDIRLDEEIPRQFFEIPRDVRFTDMRAHPGAPPH
jgi:hypothetical protein